ncbi:hypothetical protein [Salinisphaera sp. C84B14]|uniref:hypothetical protein n=1 Tax=Salinisphaera sp. C84B14 TaxID=1304155 RepID=UPI003341E9A8
MIEAEVSQALKQFFEDRGLNPLGKLNAFDHADDAAERSFEIDLAIGPCGTKGNRAPEQICEDRKLFESGSEVIDPVIRELAEVSLFPAGRSQIQSWTEAPNPNPLFGIAVEIENNSSKYLLGSLLAAAIAGRWGMLIVPNRDGADRWIRTIDRMMHKGSQSPVPSNIIIFAWDELKQKLDDG